MGRLEELKRYERIKEEADRIIVVATNPILSSVLLKAFDTDFCIISPDPISNLDTLEMELVYGDAFKGKKVTVLFEQECANITDSTAVDDYCDRWREVGILVEVECVNARALLSPAATEYISIPSYRVYIGVNEGDPVVNADEIITGDITLKMEEVTNALLKATDVYVTKDQRESLEGYMRGINRDIAVWNYAKGIAAASNALADALADWPLNKLD